MFPGLDRYELSVSYQLSLVKLIKKSRNTGYRVPFTLGEANKKLSIMSHMSSSVIELYPLTVIGHQPLMTTVM